MDTWGNRVVLVAVADASRRETYREWLGSEYTVWTVGDRLAIYECVTSAIDVVLVGSDVLEGEGLDTGRLRAETDGCRVVLVGAGETTADVDETLATPDAGSLAATADRLLGEVACDRLLVESHSLAETKARFERNFDGRPRDAPEAYRRARDRFHELDRRLDEILTRTDVDWPTLFERGPSEVGGRETSPAIE